MVSQTLILLSLTSSFLLKSVEIKGLHWYEKDGILSRFGYGEGASASIKDLQDGLRRLFKSGFFSDIRMELTKENNVATLVLYVKENPRVKSLSFVGNKKIKTSVLRDTLVIRQGIPISKRNLFIWTQTIISLYKEKGFLKVDVTPELGTPDSLGYVDLTFRIKEGPSYIIRRIEIVGNKIYPDEAIEVRLKNREKRWYRKAKFLPDEWQNDLDRILEFYREVGHPDARIDSTKFDYREDGLYITVYLTEGKRYWFGETYFTGNTVFSDSQLLSVVNLSKDKPPLVERLKKLIGKSYYVPGVYRKERVDNAIAGIAGLYADSGYLFVSIIPEESMASDSVIDVTFHIKEGNRVRVRKIIIAGNTRTYESVIRREIDLMPGEYFSRALAIKSQRDLYFLNYFESVNLDFETTEDSGYIDIVFRVKEKPTGQMGLGGSYSATYGPSLYLQFQNPNFLGRGQRLNAMVEYGTKRRNFQLGFTEPYLFGQRHSLGGELYDVTTYLPEYTTRRQGGSVTYSRFLWNDYWRFTSTYRLENISLRDISPSLRGLPEFKFWEEKSPLLTSSLELTTTYDSRDRIFNATQGRVASWLIQPAGGPLLGDVHYLKNELKLSQHVSFGKWVSYLGLRAGHIFSLTPDEDVPFYERYYLGDIGPYGLRGYPWRSVSPVVNGKKVGGRMFGIITFEERYRISETMYILGFVDIGDAWLKMSDIDLWNSRKGVGVGIRMEVPMLGIIGLDIGYGLARHQWMPHIQFGASF